MSAAIVVCLWLHYAALLTLFGAAACRLLVLREEAAFGTDRMLRRVLGASIALAIVTVVALLSLESASMGGSWKEGLDTDTIVAVLTDTEFGRVWQRRIVLAALSAMAVAATSPRRPWIAGASALLLASLALVGHAAMVEGIVGELRRLNQAAHLLAAGAWLGGLAPLLLTLAATRANPAAALPMLHRFSTYGTLAVAVILVTGAINAATLVGGVAGLVGTPYGWTLLAKLALVAGLIAFAGVNRFRLVPRIARDPERAAVRLHRSVTWEIALGALVVLVASLLGTLAPPGA